jgi:hypothetical protein
MHPHPDAPTCFYSVDYEQGGREGRGATDKTKALIFGYWQ